MRALKLIAKVIFTIAGILVVTLLTLLIVFGWSSLNRAQAHGACEMRIIEQKIEPAFKANEYRRACMSSKGYGMHASCYANDYTNDSCFIPRWMFWSNKV